MVIELGFLVVVVGCCVWCFNLFAVVGLCLYLCSCWDLLVWYLFCSGWFGVWFVLLFCGRSSVVVWIDRFVVG